LHLKLFRRLCLANRLVDLIDLDDLIRGKAALDLCRLCSLKCPLADRFDSRVKISHSQGSKRTENSGVSPGI